MIESTQLGPDSSGKISEAYLTGKLGVNMANEKSETGELSYSLISIVGLNKLFKFVTGNKLKHLMQNCVRMSHGVDLLLVKGLRN